LLAGKGVGLASYLLIGFYYLRNSAANAGKKAFVVNRIGDFGFLLAMFLLIAHPALRTAHRSKKTAPAPGCAAIAQRFLAYAQSAKVRDEQEHRQQKAKVANTLTTKAFLPAFAAELRKIVEADQQV